MVEPMSKLGAFCRKTRVELGLVLREAEERSGLSYSEISAIERGDRPADSISLATSARLARLFGIDPALFAAAAIIASQSEKNPDDHRTFEDILGSLKRKRPTAQVAT
jgi:transcriptional regulator with XRE-family HTH domain